MKEKKIEDDPTRTGNLEDWNLTLYQLRYAPSAVHFRISKNLR